MDISDNYFFSETEKIDEIIDETSEQNLEGIEDLEEPNLDEIGLMEERCSGLWNQIKDANVLNGSEFSVCFLNNKINFYFKFKWETG
ncbi:unnamed protein product [Meloidogyne enterolobii]|uniref:Uncharacterized protein n=1 Tax=Meloidogyne enterolobii TaxID=390850 RepID=A0ACB1A999_MELEN